MQKTKASPSPQRATAVPRLEHHPAAQRRGVAEVTLPPAHLWALAVPPHRDARQGCCPRMLSVPRAAQHRAASQGHTRSTPGPGSLQPWEFGHKQPSHRLGTLCSSNGAPRAPVLIWFSSKRWSPGCQMQLFDKTQETATLAQKCTRPWSCRRASTYTASHVQGRAGSRRGHGAAPAGGPALSLGIGTGQRSPHGCIHPGNWQRGCLLRC